MTTAGYILMVPENQIPLQSLISPKYSASRGDHGWHTYYVPGIPKEVSFWEAGADPQWHMKSRDNALGRHLQRARGVPPGGGQEGGVAMPAEPPTLFSPT